jgi:hypothetical protein
VTILGFKDGFKDFSVDFPLEKKWDSGLRKKIKLFILVLTGFDISSYLTYRQFWKKRNKFKEYDFVQLINENSFFCDYKKNGSQFSLRAILLINKILTFATASCIASWLTCIWIGTTFVIIITTMAAMTIIATTTTTARTRLITT